MKRLLIVLLVLALAAGAANATRPVVETSAIGRDEVSQSRATQFWFDDMESGEDGWTHGDFTASGAPPRFHVDTYMAYGGSGSSWWCGSFDYDLDGGYGNSWYEYLNIPATDISAGGPYTVLTFAYRTDSEPTYDFMYVQAESLGVWTDLGPGYDAYAPWTDVGTYGYLVKTYDNPFMGRFLFTSDGAWSDGDGENTVGGGCAVDIIQLADFINGLQFFFDDVESGGLCVPGHPGSSGDYWHIKYDVCSSFSVPNSWWCGDDADTSLIPPFLNNWLQSPWVPVPANFTCKVKQAIHFEVPTVDNDGISIYVTFDGINYYGLVAYWGDFGTCDGWGGTAYNTGFDCTATDAGWPQTQVAVMYVMNTTANGCGPGAGGGAGITIDNVWFEGDIIVPVESRTWGGIKALYR